MPLISVCCSMPTAESVVNSFKVFLKTTEKTLFWSNVKCEIESFSQALAKRLRQLTMAYFNRHFKGEKPRVKWQ